MAEGRTAQLIDVYREKGLEKVWKELRVGMLLLAEEAQKCWPWRSFRRWLD